MLSSWVARDHHFGSHTDDQRTQFIAIIRLGCQRRIAALAGVRISLRGWQSIDSPVDLARQSTSGTPQSLIPPFGPPPFPVAPC